jgi:hypothetical protein
MRIRKKILIILSKISKNVVSLQYQNNIKIKWKKKN